MSFKERFENMQINLYQFYQMGIYCFLVIASANIFTLYYQWELLMLSAKVSSLFGVLFNFGLVLFFKYLKNSLPGNQEESKAPEEIDFDKAIDDLETN